MSAYLQQIGYILSFPFALRALVVGMLVALWLWALEYSPQGLIPGGYRL